jgi:hypothetical protein
VLELTTAVNKDGKKLRASTGHGNLPWPVFHLNHQDLKEIRQEIRRKFMRSPTVKRWMSLPTHGLLNNQDQNSNFAENNKKFITTQSARR